MVRLGFEPRNPKELVYSQPRLSTSLPHHHKRLGSHVGCDPSLSSQLPALAPIREDWFAVSTAAVGVGP